MALFSKETQTPAPETRSETVTTGGASVLGPGISVEGRLTGTQTLIVEGHVKGEIHLTGDLRIAAAAMVEATVHAQNVIVEGTVAGDIAAGKKIELMASARVDGNIRAPKIVVSEGAKFRGAVDMGVERPKEQ
jgi:cytoskeletal protein CcmA (bactofilin family)